MCDAAEGSASLIIEGTVQETETIPEGETLERFAAEASCFECMSLNVEDFDVCRTDDGIIVAGALLDDSQNVTVAQIVEILTSNPNNEPVFVGLSCQKK